jgi:cyclohexadieny/prephenate dehydrogenase
VVQVFFTVMRIGTLAIVGVGLLGGSIALSARRRGVAGRVVGTDTSREAVRRALAGGLLDEACPSLEGAVGGAEVVVFCTPVDCIAEGVRSAAAACAPGTLLTDVGSTKSVVVRGVEGRLPAGASFVGSHPLAGSEKNGPEHACADLLEDRLVVVTPTATTDAGALDRVGQFWEALGARVKVMSPEEHDRAVALTSHLPHLVASALAGVLPPAWGELTAGGFRDGTRTASGDPGLWSAIFRTNPRAVLDALDAFQERLGRFRQALADADRELLEALLRQGKQARDALPPR